MRMNFMLTKERRFFVQKAVCVDDFFFTFFFVKMMVELWCSYDGPFCLFFLWDRDVQEGIFGNDKMSYFGKWTVGCSLIEDKIGKKFFGLFIIYFFIQNLL
ncbi:hypothetical protein [Sphingobacterium ginsenosidimutans]|uniref:Uncharacterized protein n=1 Tax=Sphingobacterium ginsenosidimutans TaxID=687845 RepID=A0ABP8AE84_9SPHI